MFGPVMNNIQSGTLSIQDIKPVRSGDDKYVGGGAIYMQMLDETGVGVDIYNYFEESDGVPAGWYWDQGEGIAPDEYTFDFGEGMVLTVPEDWTDVSFQMAGEVDTKSVVIPLPVKTSIFGNTRPVELSIQDIVPSRTGDDKYVGGGSIYMQILDETGVGVDIYNYFEESDGVPAGWYWDQGEGIAPDEYTFKIGEAMVLTVPEDWTDAIFTLPPVIAPTPAE